MSINEFRQLQIQQRGQEETGRQSKFNNVKVEVDGIIFDSRKEAKVYGQLKMQKAARLIKGFEMQKVFELVVNGQLIAKYKADFVIEHLDDRLEVIDVKSKATAILAVYRLKKKLMRAIFNIEVIEK